MAEINQGGYIIFAFLATFAVVVYGTCDEPCDSSLCPDPAQLEGAACPAGVVMDECNCCYVCGNPEFALCTHEDLPSQRDNAYLGQCGEGLVCTVRDDMPSDAEPESICICSNQEMICGSDDVTYENTCQMAVASNEQGQDIQVQDTNPCPTAPRIIAPPENVRDEEGESTALICEAIGFPIPVIEWVWKRVDGKTGFLPSDDRRISAYNRGGPEKMQVTGWLQIMDIQKEHEGDYTCIAQNTLGMDKSVARLNVEEQVGENDREGQNEVEDYNRKKNRNYRNRNSRRGSTE